MKSSAIYNRHDPADVARYLATLPTKQHRLAWMARFTPRVAAAVKAELIKINNARNP